MLNIIEFTSGEEFLFEKFSMKILPLVHSIESVAFYIKENEARMKIAEKNLDTIADGEMSPENEQKFINAFAKDQNDYDDEAEIIDTIEHKKDDDEVN